MTPDILSQYAAFEQAIAADPDDITTQVVFADWLDEHHEMAAQLLVKVRAELAQWVQPCEQFTIDHDWQSCQWCSTSNEVRQQVLDRLGYTRALARITAADARDLRLAVVMRKIIAAGNELAAVRAERWKATPEYRLSVPCDREYELAGLDLAARREYAGVCRAYGDSDRATFIDIQLEITTWRLCPNVHLHKPSQRCPECERRSVLRRRERDLLTDDNRERWFAIPSLGVQLEGNANKLIWWIQPSGPRIEGYIHRGFVEVITLSAADALAHLDALCRATPLRSVTLTTLPEAGNPDPGIIRLGAGDVRVQCQVSRDIDSMPFGQRGLIQLALTTLWPHLSFTLPTRDPGTAEMRERLHPWAEQGTRADRDRSRHP